MVQVTIGGQPGSGKSTIGKLLAERLKMPYFGMGEMRRKYAQERGMTINELNARAENDPTTDKMVDEFQTRLPQKYESFVSDGRTAYHFLPKSFKVYLTVNQRVAAERLLQTRRDTERLLSVEDGMQKLARRDSSDRIRYQKLYGIDHTVLSQYDLVLDTTHTTVEQAVDHIVAEMKKRGLLQHKPL